MSMGPIILFTDFGLSGPWIGQVKYALWREHPAMPVFDLMHDVPASNVQAAAYLLAAFSQQYQPGSVFLSVVDPGVGSDRGIAVLEADGRWFVGPDNGLFDIVARRAGHHQYWTVEEGGLVDLASATFHGRDVFAPIAAKVADNLALNLERATGPLVAQPAWPDGLTEIIYIDHFGNACSGLFAADYPDLAEISVGGKRLLRARTYSDVAPGEAFFYENSNGLLEVAVNQGRADRIPGLNLGSSIAF